jgi:hypothetical protein
MIIQPERWTPHQQHDTTVQAWSDGFCLTDWCTAKRWVVRRDARLSDLWLVAASSMEPTWEIAGVVPVCPLCGTNLSPHVEGVGEAPGVADNPLAAYAHRLAA